MKVYLGGTVNGSTWRDYIVSKIKIDYFNPVVKNWDELAHKKELYERRHCDFVLYVLTPKMTGFYSLAEVTDDAIKRPDRTIFCFLKEDGQDEFSDDELISLHNVGKRIERNGGLWLQSLEEVIEHLNTAKKQVEDFSLQENTAIDAFISFGRKSSKHFVVEMSDYLQKNQLSTWFDDGLVPLEIRHLEQVNHLIERSHNFIFVISSHSVRSEYCIRELEYARKLKKRVIPIMHEQPHTFLDNMPFEIRNGKILYYSTKSAQVKLFENIKKSILDEADYIEKHTDLLLQSLTWYKSQKDPKKLLYGLERLDASKWLRRTFENVRPPVRPSDFHKAYIEASENLSISKQILHFLNRVTSAITDRKSFDNFIGIVSLANPISLLPQLYNILFTHADLCSVSEYTFGLFAFLNLCFALVGIKQKNLGMFISMFLSMLINLLIVGMKLSHPIGC